MVPTLPQVSASPRPGANLIRPLRGRFPAIIGQQNIFLKNVEDASTVGCGLYGRPKDPVYPAICWLCWNYVPLRAAIKAAPYSGHLSDRPRRGRIRLAPCRSVAQTWGYGIPRLNTSSKRANLNAPCFTLAWTLAACEKGSPSPRTLYVWCRRYPRFRLRLDLGLT